MYNKILFEKRKVPIEVYIYFKKKKKISTEFLKNATICISFNENLIRVDGGHFDFHSVNQYFGFFSQNYQGK